MEKSIYISLNCGCQAEVAKKLIEEKKVSHALVQYDKHEEIDRHIGNPNLDFFPEAIGILCNYEEICDINSLPYPSEKIIDECLRYESMAIHLGMRNTELPITIYDEEKRKYLKHLRYWNYMFDTYNIKYVFFQDVPHAMHNYVIYALAQVKGAKVLMLAPCSIYKRGVYGNTIESLGQNIGEYFRKICSNTVQYELFGETENFYKAIKGETKKEEEGNSWLTQNAGNKKLVRAKRKRTMEILHWKYIGRRSVLRPQRELIIKILVDTLKRRTIKNIGKHIRDYKIDMRDVKLVRYYLKNFLVGYKGYNKKYAVDPDYSKKYILFMLQQTPEQTTLPRAGEFCDQYTSIQLLARIAEKENLEVYVKEHYVQPFREKEFYEGLSKIKNVRFIKSTSNTYNDIENAVAVATQTGTCILEGMIKGKPVLVLGKGHFWKNAPGVYEVVDETTGKKALKNSLESYIYDEEIVKKYFYAIQQQTISWRDMHCFEYSEEEQRSNYNNILGIIEQFW